MRSASPPSWWARGQEHASARASSASSSGMDTRREAEFHSVDVDFHGPGASLVPWGLKRRPCGPCGRWDFVGLLQLLGFTVGRASN